MNRMTTALSLIVLITAAATLSAQRMYVLDGTGSGVTETIDLPSAPNPAGGVPGTPLGLINFSGTSGGVTGGHCIDQINQWIYSIDGSTNVVSIDYLRPYFDSCAPPAPLPAPGTINFSPVSGLAIDAVGGELWICSGGVFGAFTPTPPYVPTSGPFGVGPLSAPLSGIGFDTNDDTLWMCSEAGEIFHYTQLGAPIGPQPVTILTSISALPFTGVAVNATNGPGVVFGPPFCSTQIGGFHVCATDGDYVYDALGTGTITIPGGVTNSLGLAFSNDGQILPGAVGCATTGTFPRIALNRPSYQGPGLQIRCYDTIPGLPGFLIADLCPVPGGLFIPLSGETLWMNPVTAFFIPIVTTQCVTVFPLGSVPPGIQFTVQWAIQDVLHPLGYCLSDAMTVTGGTI